MRKKIITLLIATIFPVGVLLAQSELPVKVVGDVKVNSEAKLRSKGSIQADIIEEEPMVESLMMVFWIYLKESFLYQMT